MPANAGIQVAAGGVSSAPHPTMDSRFCGNDAIVPALRSGGAVDKAFYVYVLASKRNGTLYIGVTSALVQRVWQHKTKAVGGFTARYGVDQLVHFEAHGDAAGAIQREKQLKNWRRAWKIQLIEERNPEWRDLYSEIAS